MAQTLAAVYASGNRCLRALYPLIAADSATTWVDVAMSGTWEGHPSGSFTFDDAAFSQIVANFERNPNPLPLDYEHATETSIPAPACGWVQRLEVRKEGGASHLYALVELTDEAAQYIREGRYRFSSGVFDFDSTDPQSGDSVGVEMLSLALTNIPFIRGQNPIRLSRRSSRNGVSMSAAVNKADLISHLRKLTAEEVTPEMAHELATALGLLGKVMSGGDGDALKDKPEDKPEAAAPATPAAPEDEKKKPMAAAATAAELGAALSAALAEQAAPVAPVAAAAPPEMPAEEPAASPDAGALLEQVMAQTGMTLEQICEALAGMASGGMPSAAPAPLTAQLSARDLTIKTLTARVAEQNAELQVFREREADEAVDLLVTTGRILDNGRGEWRTLYLSNRKMYDSLAAKLPETVPVGKHATSQVPPTQGTPAIDESDPDVQRWRRQLAATRLSDAAKDAHIRKCLAQRNGAPARV